MTNSFLTSIFILVSLVLFSTSCKKKIENNNAELFLWKSTTFEFKNKFRDNDQFVSTESYLLEVRSYDDKSGIFNMPRIFTGLIIKSKDYYNLIFPYTDLKYPYDNLDNLEGNWCYLHFFNSKMKKGDTIHPMYYPLFDNDSIDFHENIILRMNDIKIVNDDTIYYFSQNYIARQFPDLHGINKIKYECFNDTTKNIKSHDTSSVSLNFKYSIKTGFEFVSMDKIGYVGDIWIPYFSGNVFSLMFEDPVR